MKGERMAPSKLDFQSKLTVYDISYTTQGIPIISAQYINLFYIKYFVLPHFTDVASTLYNTTGNV